MSLSLNQDGWKRTDAILRSAIEAHLPSGEIPRAWFEPDLDSAMHYARSLVVLTDQRLLAASWENGAVTAVVHTMEPSFTLSASEARGAGELELFSPQGRLAVWRYTSAQGGAAHRLVEELSTQRRREADREVHDDADDSAIPAGPICSSCGAVLPPDVENCPTCEPPITGTAGPLFRLLRFSRPRIGAILLGFGLTLASTGMGLIPPYLTMPLMDRVLVPYQKGENVDTSLVFWLLLGLAGASVGAWLLGWARTFVVARVSERISADLRNQTYAHMQQLSLAFFGSKRTGDLISRVGSDTDRICFFLSVYLLDFGTDLLLIAMTACILVTIDPMLALMTLAPFPLIAYLVHLVRSRLRRGFTLGSRAWSEMTSVLADTIPGMRVVKAFAQEPREINRFRRANDAVVSANDRVNTVWSFFGPMVTLLTDFGLLAIWAFGAWRIFQHQITVGELTAFLAYIGRFYIRLDSMSRTISAFQRAAASSQRIFEILDRSPSVAEPTHPVSPGRLRGEIEFQNVGFRYGSRRVIEGVDLKIWPGEMIGLVGPSGAGKSTLINLVGRFYDVSEGTILVDGVDVRSFPINEYRQNIGIVLQEPFLFYGTIAENIAYGKPNATRTEVIQAARAARAHEFILRLPDGYDSLVGERGQMLSGGERQRISIARALLIDPRILILDEATSSVDTETEREIQLALENLIRGRTTIAIAHRLSTLRRADRLVVIERGRIAEVGKHGDLLQSSGTYARLHHAQLEAAQG